MGERWARGASERSATISDIHTNATVLAFQQISLRVVSDVDAFEGYAESSQLAVTWLNHNALFGAAQVYPIVRVHFQPRMRIRDPSRRTEADNACLDWLVGQKPFSHLVSASKPSDNLILLFLALGMSEDEPIRVGSAKSMYSWAKRRAAPRLYAAMRDIKCLSLLVGTLSTGTLPPGEAMTSKRQRLESTERSGLPTKVWRLVSRALLDAPADQNVTTR
jgi:hypothetical protein